MVQALQEISVEDRHQQLENSINDLKVWKIFTKYFEFLGGYTWNIKHIILDFWGDILGILSILYWTFGGIYLEY